MRASRVIVAWVSVIALLMFVEVAEITHVFTLPIQSAPAYLFSFIFALVFTTILALVGAIFIGIYISHRLSSPSGFTPFEEEMLKMRSDLKEVKRQLEVLRTHPADTPPADPSTRAGDPP